jgi:hypothetical protein
LGDFVGTFGSAVAVIVAVGSLVSEQHRFEGERRRLDIDQRTRIYAWLEPRSTDSGYRVWLLRFENQTSVPIYEWTVELGSPDLQLRSDTLGPIRPGASELQVTSLAGTPVGSEPKLTLEFVDSAQVRWRREPSGRLVGDEGNDGQPRTRA